MMKSLRASTAIATRLSSPETITYARTRTPFLSRASNNQTPPQQHRTFFDNPFAPKVQSLSATRTLPYPSSVLYSIISDVPSYSSFVPFCHSSSVTKFSQPDAEGKKWPEEGKLVVGFNNDISESFYSRIYCVPGEVIEAVSGETETSLGRERVGHHNPRPAKGEDPSRNASVLTHLLTRWTLKPLGKGQVAGGEERTEVSLNIDYAFANPLYAALSAAAAPKVADKMIRAFEERVKTVLDGK